MRVAVTGASGRFGRVLLEALRGEGHEVRGFDHRLRRDAPDGVEIVDVRERAAAYGIARGMDAVVHLANHTDSGRIDDQRLLFENTAMNMNVFQAAWESRVERIVFASSIQVIAGRRYIGWGEEGPSGLTYLPLDSAAPANPGNAYALSKVLGEQALEYFVRRGLKLGCALRLPWIMHGDMAKYRLPPGKEWRGTGLDEGFAFIGAESAARLVGRVLSCGLEGYHCFLPADEGVVSAGTPAELIAHHYPNVPLRRPAGELKGLVDTGGIERATGWAPVRAGA